MHINLNKKVKNMILAKKIFNAFTQILIFIFSGIQLMYFLFITLHK